MVLLAKVNPQFVNTPAGKFQMGSTQDDRYVVIGIRAVRPQGSRG